MNGKNPAMIPRQILTVRGIGDSESPYWTASSPDGNELLLEPDESVLFTGACRVSQISPKAWALPDTTKVVVTNRRTAFLTTQFDTGGGWIGFGAVGLAIAVTADIVGKRRAAARSAGKVAIGHVRHEWVTGITLRRVKALIGAVDTYIALAVASSAGTNVIELWRPRAVNEQFARWLVSAISGHRLALLPPESAPADLHRYIEGGHDPAATGRQNDLGWFFPGNTNEFISMARTAYAPAAKAPRP